MSKRFLTYETETNNTCVKDGNFECSHDSKKNND